MILIESNDDRTRPKLFDSACAQYGSEEIWVQGAKPWRLTTFEEVQSGKMNSLLRYNLAVGSVDFMREVFRQMEVEMPWLPNTNRGHRLMTLDEARKQVADTKRSLFIKPIQIKLFTGFVLDGMSYSSIAGLPGDTKVLAYLPFDCRIASEWRVYIHQKQIVDARNYSGDFKISPDYSYVDDMKIWLMYEMNNGGMKTPEAYTIDIGILEAGNENVVIEFQDMWAIGNYGVPNDLYVRMLKDRYFQIING